MKTKNFDPLTMPGSLTEVWTFDFQEVPHDITVKEIWEFVVISLMTVFGDERPVYIVASPEITILFEMGCSSWLNTWDGNDLCRIRGSLPRFQGQDIPTYKCQKKGFPKWDLYIRMEKGTKLVKFLNWRV